MVYFPGYALATLLHRDVTALDPGPPSSLPTDPDTKVDIASLTWEDKERVLRLLFAKINNVQVQYRAKDLKNIQCTAVEQINSCDGHVLSTHPVTLRRIQGR